MQSPTVRTETFLRTDIHNILRALDAANRELAEHLPLPEVAVYRKGYLAALQSVAQAVGLELTQIDNQAYQYESRCGENNGAGVFAKNQPRSRQF